MGIKSIKFKISVIIAALVIVPTVIVGLSSYEISKDLLNDLSQSEYLELNNEIADAINRMFSGYLSGIAMVAENSYTEGIVENSKNEEALMDLFENYVDNYEDAYQIYMGTKDKAIFIYPETQLSKEFDPTTRPWYIMAEEKGSPGWTDMYEDALTGDLSISGTAPVFDGDEFIGAVAINLDLTGLCEKVEDIAVGKDGYVFIIDDKATIIAHPDDSRIGEQSTVPEILALPDSGEMEGIIYYTYEDGEGEVLDKYALYTYIPEMRWYVLTSMNVDEISDSTAVLLKNVAIILLISLLIAIVIGVFFAGSIIKPINRIVADMKRVEAGDMTVTSQIKSTDELGVLAKSFNNMTRNIRGLMEQAATVAVEVSASSQELAMNADEVSASSAEVTCTVEEIAQGSSEQAKDTEKAVGIAAKLGDMFKELNKNSSDISANAVNVKEINLEGARVLEDLRNKSECNNQSTVKINQAIFELDTKSNDIDSIVQTISSIASQTNLLALNASIEAARAGEHGRGFSVVAEEIRKLAEESSKSANQIGALIAAIQKQTKNTVEIMDEFKGNSEAQYHSVAAMSNSFDTISNAIGDITIQINAIDGFITEMLESKNEIIEAVTNISAVSEETAASSEEVSATMEQQNATIESVATAADKLNALAQKLNEQIRKFTI
jgi:methyl-accepting chemotaxis protein